jgi:hypothetical protein
VEENCGDNLNLASKNNGNGVIGRGSIFVFSIQLLQEGRMSEIIIAN